MKITAFTLFVSTLTSASAFAPAQVGRCNTAIKAENDNGDLWGNPTKKDGDDDMSIALPFVPRPKLLDGSFPGDVGFE